eukprot:gene3734-4256_t
MKLDPSEYGLNAKFPWWQAGSTWYCEANISLLVISRGKLSKCPEASDIDVTMAATTFLAAILLCALIPNCISVLQTCDRAYDKLGCFKGKANNELLLFDRGNIAWGQIAEYMHNLACKCVEEIKRKNKDENKGYVGFSLHYYGECYGQTQAHLDAFTGRDNSHLCVGDQTYSKCDESHQECAGTEEAEYVYKLKGLSGEKNVDGGLEEWGQWTKCFPSCGDGVRNRERTCTKPIPQGNGKDCSALGNLTEIAFCKSSPCPVDGGFTDWAEFGSCSKKCGGGKQQRVRTCTDPSPANGGKACVGPTSEEQSCNTDPCPINGVWSKWTKFDACSKTCGGGKKKRYRGCTNPKPQFGGADCEGKSVDEQSCGTKKCPVHGGYTTWSKWSSCTESCGSGSRKRKRTCTNPRAKYGGRDCKIFGSSSQTGRCNTHNCPEKTSYACEGKAMSLSCSGSLRIRITHASYGRKNKSRCRWGLDWFWNTRCHAGSSWGKVRGSCQGKKSCRISAKNSVFGDPCFLTPKYLTVKYRCHS